MYTLRGEIAHQNEIITVLSGEKDSKPCVKETKSLTINPVEGQMDSESTESSCLQDKDSAVETSISISLRKRGKDASKEEGLRLQVLFE